MLLDQHLYHGLQLFDAEGEGRDVLQVVPNIGGFRIEQELQLEIVLSLGVAIRDLGVGHR